MKMKTSRGKAGMDEATIVGDFESESIPAFPLWNPVY